MWRRRKTAGTWHVSHGKGPPLILLGGVHLDHAYLRPWLDPLASAARLVFLDHRGTGRSERPDLSAFTHETWADDVEDLRQELELGQIILFGHSYGGFLALEYALRYPNALRALILCDTAAAFDYIDVALGIARQRGTDAQVELLTRAFSSPLPDDDTLRQVWLDVAPVYFRQLDGHVLERFADHCTYSVDAFNHAYFTCLPHYGVAERLAEIDVPTLVLCGRHDWVTPVQPAAQRLNRELPRSELVVFEESGHYPFIEEQERFVEVVRDWMERTGAGVAA